MNYLALCVRMAVTNCMRASQTLSQKYKEPVVNTGLDGCR